MSFPTYNQQNNCGNTKVSAKYVANNLDMYEKRVNTHTHTHTHTHILTARILQIKQLITKRYQPEIVIH